MNVPFDLMKEVEAPFDKKEIYVTEFKEDTPSKIYTNVWENLLVIVLEGKKKLQYQNFECEIGEGQWGFFKSGNYIMNQILNPRKQHYKSLLLFYSDEFIREFLDKHKLRTNVKVIHKGSLQYGNVNEFMKKEVHHLESLVEVADGTMTPILKLKAEELLLYILQQDRGEFLAFVESISGHNYDFQKYIEAHYTQYQEIETLAKDLNMSLSTFKRKFAEVYQESPSKWLKEKKLEYAKTILHNTDYSITDICFMSGFNAVSTFNALFKKRYGIVPSKMREQIFSIS